MSMTLEEAIEHAEDIAVSAIGCECRDEHRQLAAWLRELQERRKESTGDYLRAVSANTERFEVLTDFATTSPEKKSW